MSDGRRDTTRSDATVPPWRPMGHGAHSLRTQPANDERVARGLPPIQELFDVNHSVPDGFTEPPSDDDLDSMLSQLDDPATATRRARFGAILASVPLAVIIVLLGRLADVSVILAWAFGLVSAVCATVALRLLSGD